jgi:hypothetical protein
MNSSGTLFYDFHIETASGSNILGFRFNRLGLRMEIDTYTKSRYEVLYRLTHSV